MATSTGTPLRVVDPDLLRALERALDEVVAIDPALATARNALLLPLKLLDAMAREAVGALGDDVLAAERLRLIVSLAKGQARLTATAPILLESHGGATRLEIEPEVALCEPSLLHMGNLAIVGLAAGRVSASIGMTFPLIGNVFGVAVAAGPAECVARAVAGGLDGAQLAALLAGMGSDVREDANASASLSSFVADGCEQHRWRCLSSLFTFVSADVASGRWDAAGAGSIRSVEPRGRCAGADVTLHVDPALGSSDGLDLKHYAPFLESGDIWVVFGSPGRRAQKRRPGEVDLENGTVTVTVPSKARPGWIGFMDDAALASANGVREAVRTAWEERNRTLPYLFRTPVPLEAIGDLPNPASPPRTPGNVFHGGRPVIAEARLTPAEVDAGATLELSWRVEGDAEVFVDPPGDPVKPGGSVELVADGSHALIERTVRAVNPCGDESRSTVHARVRSTIVSVELLQDGAPPVVAGEAVAVRVGLAPPDAIGWVDVSVANWTERAPIVDGAAELTVPGQLVQDGLAGQVVAVGPREAIDDREAFGPVRLGVRTRRRVVLLRPARVRRRLERVTAGEARTHLEQAARVLGASLDVYEPALAADEELRVDAMPDCADAFPTLGMLERLNVMAARHPGLEDALWLALVPETEEGFHQMEPGDAAATVAVCTPSHVATVLAAPGWTAQKPTARLRVVGVVDAYGVVQLDPLRIEERGAGEGSSFVSDLSLNLLSGASVRGRYAVRVLSDGVPARFVALLPVGPDIDGLEVRVDPAPLRPRELRQIANGVRPPPATCRLVGSDGRLDCRPPGSDDGLRRKVSRPDGAPHVSRVTVKDGVARWHYAHSADLRGSFTVEISRRGAWSPIAEARPCAESVELPLGLIPQAENVDRLRVVASDGWNAATIERPLKRPPQPYRAVARDGGGGVLWADLDFDGDDFDYDRVAWTLENRKTTVKGAFVRLPEGFVGTVAMKVSEASAVMEDKRLVTGAGVVPRGPRGVAIDAG